MEIKINKREAYLLVLALQQKINTLGAVPAPLADIEIEEYTKLYNTLTGFMEGEKK